MRCTYETIFDPGFCGSPASADEDVFWTEDGDAVQGELDAAEQLGQRIAGHFDALTTFEIADADNVDNLSEAKDKAVCQRGICSCSVSMVSVDGRLLPYPETRFNGWDLPNLDVNLGF